MKRLFVFIFLSMLLFFFYYKVFSKEESFRENKQLFCKALVLAYPGGSKECSQEGLILKNNKIIYYDESNANKNTLTIEKIFTPFYSFGEGVAVGDGGRNRPYQLFALVYGHKNKEIVHHLKRINFFGSSLYFNSNNGAFEALEMVKKELEEVIQKKKVDKRYLLHSTSFNYRPISHSHFISAHGYGIAIDINVGYAHNYWLWPKAKASNIKLPSLIVDIFEQNGFIWGGRWVHFDDMHFEYRPEFLIYQKLKNDKEDSND
jgi:hypothetical protein